MGRRYDESPTLGELLLFVAFIGVFSIVLVMLWVRSV